MPKDWTDRRVDALDRKVDADIRELRSEMAEMRRTMIQGFIGLASTMVAGFGTLGTMIILTRP